MQSASVVNALTSNSVGSNNTASGRVLDPGAVVKQRYLTIGGVTIRRTMKRKSSRALLPVEKDAFRSNALIKYLEMIAAWVGDKDLACQQLAIAIRIPSTTTYGELNPEPW